VGLRVYFRSSGGARSKPRKRKGPRKASLQVKEPKSFRSSTKKASLESVGEIRLVFITLQQCQTSCFEFDRLGNVKAQFEIVRLGGQRKLSEKWEDPVLSLNDLSLQELVKSFKGQKTDLEKMDLTKGIFAVDAGTADKLSMDPGTFTKGSEVVLEPLISSLLNFLSGLLLE
jgi:hypothetical protein